jgi:hypothetical protein
MFEVGRPCICHQQPHHETGGHGVTRVIEESDGYKAKHQSAVSPEPDILVQDIESNGSYNKEGAFHIVVPGKDEIYAAI